MIILFLSVLFVSTVSSIPIEKDGQAKVLNYENNVDEDGNYHFSFETSNGIYRSEDGKFVDDEKLGRHLVVNGYFSYTDPDGEFQYILYKADENGFQIVPAKKGVEFSLPSAAVATLLG